MIRSQQERSPAIWFCAVQSTARRPKGFRLVVSAARNDLLDLCPPAEGHSIGLMNPSFAHARSLADLNWTLTVSKEIARTREKLNQPGLDVAAFVTCVLQFHPPHAGLPVVLDNARAPSLLLGIGRSARYTTRVPA